MPLFRKPSNAKSGPLGNVGQATIEYVLLLVVVVGLIATVATKIVKPLGSFIDNYMGSYVQCILEMGELPSLGNDKDTALKDEGCNAKFESATLADGRPPIKPGSGGGSGENEGKGGGGSAGRGGGGSSGSRGKSRLTSSSGGSSGVDGAGSVNDSKKTTIAGSEAGGGGSSYMNFGQQGENIIIRRRAKQVTVNGDRFSEGELERLKKKGEKEKQDKPVIVGDANTQGPKKLLIKPQPTRELASESEDISFGNFLRIIFIAGIIIALVLLIGGQALQMSKDSQK